MSYKSDFLRVLSERGFIADCTDFEGLDALLAAERVTGYIGFDATAPSLHAGSLIQIMLLYWLQQTGHRPIALMGGGTTKIGDPSGRDESRQLLDEATIGANIDRFRAIFEKMLDFGDDKALMLNNIEWLDDINYIEFLRDYGRHFTINRMLTMDSVRLRLDREQPLTFLEFNYMILQAYDFVELNRRYDCRLQMGGSDQWGNIVNGMELGRRCETPQLFGLTSHLLTTASGKKMGKTAEGAVWLNADMLSPWDYWQYFRNTEDADVGRFLKLYTTLPMDEIARLAALEGAEINEAKKVLATEATAMVHGREEADKALRTAEETFEKGGLSADLPTVTLPKGDLDAGLGVVQAFVAAGLAESNGDARRLIKGGGAKLNDAPITDEKVQVSSADLNADGTIKLSAGKKRHALIKPS